MPSGSLNSAKTMSMFEKTDNLQNRLPMCLFTGTPAAVKILFSDTVPNSASGCRRISARTMPVLTVSSLRPDCAGALPPALYSCMNICHDDGGAVYFEICLPDRALAKEKLPKYQMTQRSPHFLRLLPHEAPSVLRHVQTESYRTILGYVGM